MATGTVFSSEKVATLVYLFGLFISKTGLQIMQAILQKFTGLEKKKI